jgi:hypothetical protein
MSALPKPTHPAARSLRILARINLRQARAARAAGSLTFAAYHLRAARDFLASARRIAAAA